MTIIDFLRDPPPWFDTSHYTMTEIMIFFSAAMLWVGAYIVIIKNIIKRKAVGIPAIAVSLNFGYEVTTAFFSLPDMGRVVVFGYWAWMLLDLFIVISVFRYGHQQIINPYIRKHFRALFSVGLLVAFAAEFFFIREIDIPMAVYDAYIINLVMSVCFIYLVFIPDFKGNSLAVAWLKFLGTGWTSVMFQMKYPDNHFLTTMYIAVALFDIFYIYLLHKRKRA